VSDNSLFDLDVHVRGPQVLKKAQSIQLLIFSVFNRRSLDHERLISVAPSLSTT
jgi:hypothetical protein